MTFWELLVFALLLSIISLRYRNLFFSFGGTLGFFALWAYNNDHPPTGVTQGSFIHLAIMFGSLIMAIGVMFMYFRNRQRGYTGYAMTKKEEIEAEARTLPRGLMDMSVDEYKAHIRTRLRRRRR